MPKKRAIKKNNVPEDALDGLSIASPSAENSDSESSKADSSDGLTVSTLDKVSMAIDSLSSFRPDQRATAFQLLQKGFRANYLGLPGLPEKWKYFETLISSLETSMRRGKPAERVAAAQCLGVFSMQLTAIENQCLVEQFHVLMESRICDSTEINSFRGACATAFTWLHFLSESKDFPGIKRLMGSLLNIFKASCLKGDGKSPVLQAPTVLLHCDCIRAWCLLYTILPSSDATALGQDIQSFLVSLLQSVYVEVRLAACDAVGVIFERIRDEGKKDFKGPYFSSLLDVFEQLANNSDKSVSKVDSKKQRSTFRNVLNFLRSREMPFEQVVKLRSERLVIDSLCRAFVYESFCRLIAVGMETHLRENELMRGVFDLGPPLLLEPLKQAAREEDKRTRRYVNQRASKIRTQKRNKSRDGRNLLELEEC